MIIAIANQKGGVAKTTSTLALGGLLAEKQACLVIDFDPQGNLTTGLGVKLQPRQTTAYEILTDEDQQAESAIVETSCGVKLIPSDITLAKGEKQILSEEGNSWFLREKLTPLREKFDYILIDCPPSLGLLTINALAAADFVLIPVQCQFFALDGLRQLLDTISRIRSRKVNPQLQILGVLPTMADRTLGSRDAIKTLKTQLQGIRIFEPVPRSTQFPDSNLAREPIHLYSREAKLIYPYQVIVKDLVG